MARSEGLLPASQAGMVCWEVLLPAAAQGSKHPQVPQVPRHLTLLNVFCSTPECSNDLTSMLVPPSRFRELESNLVDARSFMN
jgi:hypothetical protein